MILELFFKYVCVIGIVFMYVVSVLFFGGFLLFIVSWLVECIGNLLVLVWYVVVVCFVLLVLVIWLWDCMGEVF